MTQSRRYRRLIVSGLLAVALLICSDLSLTPMAIAAEAEWQPLFNGKNLDGWYTYIQKQGRDKDPDHLIQVHDGMVHGYKDAVEGSEQPHGYICTLEEYSRYKLKFQYKWGGKRFAPRAETIRDAGVLFHVIGEDGHAFDVWPMSVECQVQEGDTGDLITVDTRCTSWIDEKKGEDDLGYPTYLSAGDGGKEIKNTWYINAGEVCDRRDGWNDVEVIVDGAKSAVFIVNGKVNQRIADIEEPVGDAWKPLERGRIVFQIESAEVCYRNIEIMELPPEASIEVDTEETSSTEPPTGVDAISLPQGFEIEVAAAAPLVNHPMMACLDDRGRLFISESDGVNRESVADILEERPHSILMLEDTDGDGAFDKRTVFAEGLVQPNGAEWCDGALYVCSAPYVWRFRDTDDDGKADEQVRVAGKFNFDGMSSAFHGPVLGPDGRLYWSGGQHGWKLAQALHDPDAGAVSGASGPDADLGVEWTRTAPGAFSSWPDGSDPENLGHGGIANPVETAFTEEGEVIGTIALFDYLDNQRRDAVVHWADGALYHVKDHNRVGLARTGVDLTPVSFRGHAAPAGIMRYRGEQFGTDYRDNFFVAEFNTHKVFRLQFERDGGTFRSHDEVFLASSDPDSHFTDVMEDADGSLLVINTGGWFLHGCPNSQIAKPSIHGEIYRIRRSDADRPEDPRGMKLLWSEATDAQLVAWLADPRFVVRDRAVQALANRGVATLPAIETALRSESPAVRRQAVWILTRISAPQARGFVRNALQDSELSVRLAALHSISLRRDAAATDQLIAILRSETPAERREAATALGRLKSRQATGPLLAAMEMGSDRFLDHAVTYALISIGDDQSLADGLTNSSPSVQRAALIALDQLQSPLLTRESIPVLLDSGDSELRDAAFEALQSRPEWADQLAGRIAQWIADESLSSDDEVALRGAVRAFWGNTQTQSLVADAVQDEKAPELTRILLLDAMALIETDEVPASWISAIGACLESPRESVVSQAIAALTERDVAEFDQRLSKIALDANRPNSQRLAAAQSLVRRLPQIPDEILTLLLDNCGEDAASVDRLAAAQAIGHAHFSPHQLARLADLVATTGPLELPALLAPFEGGTDDELGSRLVESLKSSPGIASFSAERLLRLLKTYPTGVQESAEPLIASLDHNRALQADRLEELVNELGVGNPEAGKQVFFGHRSACSSCHRIGAEGGNVGPNLSRIGEIRTRRDLIEAVVFPSSSFAREYEPYSVLTTDGQAYAGVISRQTPHAIHLRGADRIEVRIERDDIEQLQPSDVSIMPQGLDKVLSPTELSDVLSFLQSLTAQADGIQ